MGIWIMITLVRHGETNDNKCGCLQGQSDTSLNEDGELQAARCGEALRTEVVNLAFASDLQRAWRTSQIILERSETGASPSMIRQERRLRERAFGEFEGKHRQLLVEYAARLRVGIFDVRPQNGENALDVQRRIDEFLWSTLFTSVRGAKWCECASCIPHTVLQYQSLASRRREREENRSACVDGASHEPDTTQPQHYHALIVTHGGVIREFTRLLFERYGCVFVNDVRTRPMNLPLEIERLTPNCAVSRFILRLSEDVDGAAATLHANGPDQVATACASGRRAGCVSSFCTELHNTDHLRS